MTECLTVDPTISVSIYYGPEEGDVLVIPPTCPEGESGLWWNALQLPDWGVRYTYAPPSAWVPGQVLLGAVGEAAAIPLRVAVRGTDGDDLEAQKAVLAAALFTYAAVIGIDADYDGDVTNIGLYRMDPVIPGWGPVTPQRAGMLAVETSLSIPVQPTGAP